MATATFDANTRSTPKIDDNALRTNQATILAVVVIAFVLGSGVGVWLLLALALALAIGAAKPGSGPIQIAYRKLLLPTGLIKPSPKQDDPAKYRFAQWMGAGCLVASALLLFAGVAALGWILAWVVAALALVNLLFNFCAGCFIFLQLRRAGVVR